MGYLDVNCHADRLYAVTVRTRDLVQGNDFIEVESLVYTIVNDLQIIAGVASAPE